MIDLFTSLRNVLPPLKLNIDDKYGKYDLTGLNKLATKYEAIVTECNNVIQYHQFILKWIRMFDSIHEGDCWNISSICAHFLAHEGKRQPEIFGINGPMVKHLECAHSAGKNLYKFWHVIPYNSVSRFQFICSPAMTFHQWSMSWELYLNSTGYDVKEFTYLGKVKDGVECRKLIPQVYYDVNIPVQLVSLELVKKQLVNKNYEVIYEQIDN